jgi:DNA-binding CsgD family transcriptional regulator
MIQHIARSGATPQEIGDLAWAGPLWEDVAGLAEEIMTSALAPTGFVRKRLPIGRMRADVYAGHAAGDGRGSTTLVVIIPPAPDAPPGKDELRQRFGLTPREAEVALLLAARRSNKEIARHLSIAQKTAERHTYGVMAKLRTSTRRDVARILGWQPRPAVPGRRGALAVGGGGA